MLQILGEAMMIATRMDDGLNDHRSRPARPLPHEPAEPRERRRGWLHLSGLLL
ncbi:MAG: hypothetical protein OEM24_02580 [Paracoccaceae bacterium]|nr:hypothetical protein [Paracoccaceae bacterium]